MEIINKQSKLNIATKSFQLLTQNILDTLKIDQSLTIVFVGDDEIKRLNKTFRHKDYVTDVLSFPFEKDEFEEKTDYLGDIVISVEQAHKQALENDLSLELEIKQLILHGILHLCGFDHETDDGEMNNLELTLRDKLSIN